MKPMAACLVALLLAHFAGAATVVLKSGKRLEVASFEQQGNYLVVTFEDGRAQSYPMSMVDMKATDEANGVVRSQPEPATPAAPSSPFREAVARRGEPVASIRDGDVGKTVVPDSEAPKEAKEEKSKAPARVAVTGFTWQLVGQNTWEVTISLANQGEFAASDVSLQVRGLDETGEETGRASGTLAGELAPGGQGTTVVTIKGEQPIAQLAFDVRWQEIRPVGERREEVIPGAAPRTASPTPAQPRPTPPPTFGIAPGGSPLAVPENPLGTTEVTTVPQVVPPTAPPGT